MHANEKHHSLEPASYEDYRDFLKARFEQLSEKRKTLSLAGVAKRSGLSKSHLQFLFKKQRHLSLDNFSKLAQTLKLNEQEEAFVYLLICKNSSKSEYVKSHFEQILASLRHEAVKTEAPSPEKSKASNLFAQQDQLPAILHSLARLKDFQEDPTWIVKHLQVPGLQSEHVKNLLKELESSGVLKRDASGRLRPGDFSFWRPNAYEGRRFEMYRNGARSVLQLMENAEIYKPSVYMLMALSFDEINLKKAERLMIELHHQLHALAKESEDPTSAVYIGNFFMNLTC